MQFWVDKVMPLTLHLAFKRHRDSFFGTASLKPPGQRGILAAKVGSEGFWDGDSDYGGGVRVGRHFGARWLVP